MMKNCTKCGELKDLIEYGTHTKASDGKRSRCKLCLEDDRLQRTYGVTLTQWNQMFVAQNGCCGVCKRHQSVLNQTLAVDHCHITKKVRGLLCSQCNRYLGYYELYIKVGFRQFDEYLNQAAAA